MKTNIAKDNISFLMPHSMMYIGADRGAPNVSSRALPESERSGLKAKLSGLVAWIVDMPARRAAITEMMAMSDRELADIGLSRADIYAVVQRDFAARRRAI